jgi:hypothetical protein
VEPTPGRQFADKRVPGAEPFQQVVINGVGFLEPNPTSWLQEILNLCSGEGIQLFSVCRSVVLTEDHARSLYTRPRTVNLRHIDSDPFPFHLSQDENERHLDVKVKTV